MHNLAIFASGNGSNAENIIRYFRQGQSITVSCICTNRPDAYVIKRAGNLDVDVLVFNRKEFTEGGSVLDFLRSHNTGWIVLAGFLWLVPGYLIREYPQRIINIHPALLPKHGGPGMYGENVHKSVIDNGDKETGITIHLIDKDYDRGHILFQAKCPVLSDDTPESLAARVHGLEYEHYPKVIEKTVLGSHC
jgi:phosphoribosylglycinamide formyltransferase 1